MFPFLIGPAGPKLRNRTHFRTYCERGLYSEGFSLKFRCELCGATLLVNMRDIEPRKEDDGFDGAFLSP